MHGSQKLVCYNVRLPSIKECSFSEYLKQNKNKKNKKDYEIPNYT